MPTQKAASSTQPAVPVLPSVRECLARAAGELHKGSSELAREWRDLAYAIHHVNKK